MTNDQSTPRETATRWGRPLGLIAVGAAAGAVLAGALSANAASPSPAPTSSSSTTDAPHGDMPQHGTAAHEDQETPITGANATKARAAALKSVGNGNAGEVTTDFTGDGYEVTVTKSDGSSVEVHLDQSFNVVDHGGFGR